MKAYVTFILVFAALVILIYSYEAYSNSSNLNLSRASAVNRIFHTELNIKETIVEAARSGAIEGFLVYSAVAIPTDTFNKRDAEKAAEAGAYARVVSLQLHEFSEDFDVLLWCGTPNEFELERLRDNMLLSENAELCGSCTHIISPTCVDFIDVNIAEKDENGKKIFESASLHLTSESNEGFFGISMYSKKYKLSSVSYIPASLGINPW